jgi:hypothetical protein
MKLPDKLKPQFCCSKDATRYALTQACVRNGMIMATNGRMAMAAIAEVDPWEEDVRQEGLIPVAALKVATGRRSKNNTYCQNIVGLLSDNTVKVRDNLNETRFIKAADCLESFPRINQLVPDNLAELKTIKINAKMLWELAQALGTEGVCIHITDDDKPEPMLVEALNHDDRIGLICGMKFDSTLSKNKALKKLQKLKPI